MSVARGTKPKLYFDTCCFLDMLQFGLKVSPKTERELHVEYCHRFLEASRKGEVEVYTSLLTTAECICLKDESAEGNHKRILTPEVKRLITGMLQSGRSGVEPVQATPLIVNRARDLEWKDGARFNTMDALHIATALSMGCDYFITTDDKLDKKGGVKVVNRLGLSFCRADAIAHLLPGSNQLRIDLVGGRSKPA